LIDKFLQEDAPEAQSTPVEEPQESTDDEEAEKTENDPEEDYFTETLAKIYIKQQRYSKALEIIKKINLKYPKKNVYFADQIRFLEKLIINNHSK
jgi:predicted Zn-dependent protease